MVEIGVCWEGTRVRGCFATPRLHGVFREIIKWAESFHIPGISTHIALDTSQRITSSFSTTHNRLSYSYMTSNYSGSPNGSQRATCRRHAGVLIAPPLVLIPMYKKEETPAHFGAGVL
jgi:hypothetical protein